MNKKLHFSKTATLLLGITLLLWAFALLFLFRIVNPDDNDAVALLGPHAGVVGAYNVVLDHVSASWGEDELFSSWYGAHDITISWSILSEGLNRSRHRMETHSAGLLIGDSSYNVSIYHNLLAHNDFHNPLIVGGGTHEIANNVIYDWACSRRKLWTRIPTRS